MPLDPNDFAMTSEIREARIKKLNTAFVKELQSPRRGTVTELALERIANALERIEQKTPAPMPWIGGTDAS